MKRSEVQREKLSPMMQQYMEIKDKYEDSIIFFRLGWTFMKCFLKTPLPHLVF